MNWQAVGAIGEVIGGVGVMVTLLYLALQVRHNTAEMRSAASESVAENLREWLLPMIRDPEVSRIWRIGVEGWEHFGTDDKARFFHITFVWLKTIEAAHYQYIRGRLDPQVWRGWEAVVVSYLLGPGIQAYWCRRREGFNPEFQSYVEALSLAGPHFSRVGEVTGETEAVRSGSRLDAGTIACGSAAVAQSSTHLSPETKRIELVRS